ncbi:unnamed protein product [Orchesella dallaii]|uniref:F-box domain-containing protein n=1 Tax=Orchesella dallaii TaxID=48710 RepID=A0ABP1RUG9_9HEXA
MDGTSAKRTKRGGADDDFSDFSSNNQESILVEYTSPITTPMLPPQIWDHVFSYLTPSVTDHMSVINTCPEWSELLHSKKTSLLLPMVLPMVMKYLPTKDILGLRKVSKHFRIITDNILQQYSRDPSKEIDRDPPLAISLNSVSSKIYQLEIDSKSMYSYSAFQSLLNQWGNGSNGNPFLTGTLCWFGFDWSTLPNDVDNSAICSSLKPLGLNIYKLIYTPAFRIRDVKLLFSLLEGNLPNLKELELMVNVDPDLSFLFRYSPRQTPVNLESLNLFRFIVDTNAGSEDAALPYLMLLREYGKQLKVLHVNSQCFDFLPIDVPFLNANLGNLRSLVVWINKNVLEKLSAVNWRHLHQLQMLSAGECKFAELLRVINNFASSLTFLRLDYQIEAGILIHGSMIELPKLKKFSTWISDKNQGWLWHFLMASCQKMEELELRIYAGEDKEKVKGYVRLAKTTFNILPKLRRIVVWDSTDYETKFVLSK